MKKRITVLPGDGVGPEVTKEAVKVLQKIAQEFGHEFVFETGLIGATAIDATGNPYPDETHDLCTKSDAILFGAIGDPKYDNDPKAKVRPEQGLLKMRKSLGLFANIRPIVAFEKSSEKSPLKKDIIQGVDFVVVRELTGGIYFGERGRSKDGNSAFDTNTYSKKEIIRVSKVAFELAISRHSGKRDASRRSSEEGRISQSHPHEPRFNRGENENQILGQVEDPPRRAENDGPKVTLVDKANVLETSRLWRETVQELSKQYKDVTLDFMFVDNAAMQIIKNPKSFDVIVTDNMFGDILTDEASVITGSIGMLPSASIGEKSALYEPIHGSYPKAAGTNTANPIGTILSAAMMLEYSFNMLGEAKTIREAVNSALQKGFGTKDIINENPFSTSEVGDKITELILINP